MKKIKYFLILFLIAIGTISYAQSNYAKQEEISKQAKKLEQIITLIDFLYVDTVSTDTIVEKAVVSMLKDLDPHSVYISQKELQQFKEPLEGSFDGIGVSFRLIKDTVVIMELISGGPSEKIGILAGDRIVKVNDSVIAGVGLKQNDVPKLLRGKKGTVVKVAVKRGKSNQLIDFNIVRDKIPLYSVDASYISDDNIGYVRLNKFSRTTKNELDTIFERFQKEKVNDIILDLTGNGGGYLDQAVSLCSYFLDKNKLVVYTEGAHSPKVEYKSNGNNIFKSGRLVVLVDESSASASEIVSGAFQDWDRGVVVGRRSFGKGLVQREYELLDKSAIRLTVAKYFTPSGRCIQKPYSSGDDEYGLDILNRYKHGELYHRDSIVFDESHKFKTLNYGKTVYAGGGIMPDDFVPLDTNLIGEYQTQLLRKNVIFPFVSNYVDQNRQELSEKYKNYKKFKDNFVVEDNFMQGLKQVAQDEGIKLDSIKTNTEVQENYLLNHIKALIASDLFSKNEFYEIYNLNNPVVKRAYEIIRDEKTYKKLLRGE